jgi:protein phosphatase
MARRLLFSSAQQKGENMTVEVTVDCHGLTDTGRQRPENQDQFLIAGLNRGMLVRQTSLDLVNQTQLTGELKGQLLLVADGMGGHAHGDRASELAVRTITSYVLNTMPWFFRLDPDREDDLVEDLAEALRRCEQILRAEGDAVPERQDMGTTLTMAYILWPRLYVVHAGDSRCYLFRDGELTQLTTDHSLAQQMVDQGILDPAKAEGSRFSDVLHNVIVADGGTELKPEVNKTVLENRDALLLCSDGLTKHVADEQIAALLERSDSAAAASSELVAAANADGGSDNVTTIVARFDAG